ncbi:hypothetical protein [Pseudanabaena sp. PCC 6802]|uniref:hypothetical protein n=1 Tax=Pseudanabaena sp. PCC 6802 TaxID=118173 RepID=UPI00034AEF15|nr:hypothetical protein [Pseudanabaena sp. PCC 6802]
MQTYSQVKNKTPINNKIPNSFKNEAEALKGGCKILKLKNNALTNCVIEEREHEGVYTQRAFYKRSVILNIYDRNGLGEFHKVTEFVIPSWYGRARISFEDLIGDGRVFLIINDLEGAKGTGISQDLLTIFGWHNGRFVPILIETTRYVEAFSAGNHTHELKANYQFVGRGNANKLAILLDYTYELNAPKQKLTRKLEWQNELRWNEQNFSFYNEELEKRRLQIPKNQIESSISEVRLNLIKSMPTDLAPDSLWKTDITKLYTKWRRG